MTSGFISWMSRRNPQKGSKVEVLCKKVIPFVPITGIWNDRKICQECLERHLEITENPYLKTFAIIDPDLG